MDDRDTESVRMTTASLITKAVFITHLVWGYLSPKERDGQGKIERNTMSMSKQI